MEITYGMMGTLLLMEQEVVVEKWNVVNYYYIADPMPAVLYLTT